MYLLPAHRLKIKEHTQEHKGAKASAGKYETKDSTIYQYQKPFLSPMSWVMYKFRPVTLFQQSYTAVYSSLRLTLLALPIDLKLLQMNYKLVLNYN